MRLISLNVALFEANNIPVSHFLSKQKPDIVCLQEVTQRIDSSVNPDYLSKSHIDKVTKSLKYSFFSPILTIKEIHLKNFHKIGNFDFDFGGFLKAGTYLKTKFKIIKKSNVFVKRNFETKITNWANWLRNLTRAVQVVDLELPSSKKVRVLNYHGIWTKEKIGDEETLRACKKILDLAKIVNYPTIIAGDFNLFPDTPSMQIFYKDFISLVDKCNIKTTRPKNNELSHLRRNVVDYIFVSKDVKVKRFEVLDSDVSDHLPLALDFKV